MTANGNSRPVSVAGALALAAVLMFHLGDGVLLGDEPALKLRASATAGGGVSTGPWTVELFRWSTEAERAPLVGTLSAPPPASPAAAADAAGRGPSTAPGAGGRAGRGGRGGRGAAAPPNPLAQLTAAVKAAPTLGFIWGDGATGYSIKYAWRAASAGGGQERIVLVTDRRLGANEPDRSVRAATASAPTADAEFTVIEMRIDSTGAGEGKTSLNANVVVDAAAQTLALDGYQAAPVMLKVTR